jgi:hypothetical protein
MKLPFRYFLNHSSTGLFEISIGPDMSDELSLVFARSTVYHGIQRTVGVNVRFIKDGYDYIKTIYETFGIAADITFAIYELNKQINDYQVFFEGKINLESYKIDKIFVTVGLEETGLVQKFTNNDDIQVNLQKLVSLGDKTINPFDQETIDLSLHSKTISKKYIGTIGDEVVAASENIDSRITRSPIPGQESEKDHWRYYSFPFISQVSELSDVSMFGGFITQEIPAPFYQVKEPGIHNFSFNINAYFKIEGWAFGLKLKHCPYYESGGGAFDTTIIRIVLRVTNGVDLVSETILYEDIKGRCGNREHIVELTNFVPSVPQMTLSLDDEVTLYCELYTDSLLMREPVDNTLNILMIGEGRTGSSMEIVALTQSPVPTSTADSLLNFETAARILQSITDEPDPFRSELFGRTDSQPFAYSQDGDASLFAITNGFQVRQFPLADKPIFASFKDWYQTMDALFNIGVGIENNKIVCERKEYFYSPVVIWSFDNVEFSKSVAREYYYNEFENGFAKWENEEVNGLDEFNSNRQWTLPISVIKNKLSKLAPYIGSGYAIEFTRRKTYQNTSTEDWKYDNDNFIISVVRSGGGFAAKKNEGYDNAEFENILDPPTAYNLDISPKRSLKNWDYILNGCLHHQQDKKVKFAFGEANYKAESKRTDEGSTVIENEDVLVSSLQTPLWIPEYYEFEAPINSDVITAMKANPYGIIQFRADSKSSYNKAFIINCKVDVENKKGNFKLLRSNI